MQYALRMFTALTQGDTICITHANEQYALDVKAVEPAKLKPSPAVCVIDTTVKVCGMMHASAVFVGLCFGMRSSVT